MATLEIGSNNNSANSISWTNYLSGYFNQNYVGALDSIILTNPTPGSLRAGNNPYYPVLSDFYINTSLISYRIDVNNTPNDTSDDLSLQMAGNFSKLAYYPTIPGGLAWAPSISSPVMTSMRWYDPSGNLIVGVTDFSFNLNNFVNSSFLDKLVSTLQTASQTGDYTTYSQLLFGSITKVNFSSDDDTWTSSLALNDKVSGGAGDDQLSSGGGNDTLSGDDGNDTLDGGTGTDTLIGGSGDDTYIVDNVGDKVYETTVAGGTVDAGGNDTVQASVSYTLGSFVENLTLTGTNTINGTGNGLANTLTGNAGNNVLDGKAGTDTMDGGDGSDIYLIGLAADHTSGEVIADTGDGVNDVDEIRFAATAASTLTLSSHISGIEQVVIGTGTAATAVTTGTVALNVNAAAVGYGLDIVGNAGANSLTGTAYADNLYGGAGNDRLDGGAGADILMGGKGNDTYVVDNAGDQVYETADVAGIIDAGGTDTVQASISYTLGSFVENLTLTGSDAINGTGNELNNILIGNDGDNFLDGGEGSDTLNGGAGKDLLVAGWGDKIDGGQNFDTLDLSQLTGTYKISGTTGSFTLTSTTAGDTYGKTITVANVEYVKLNDTTTESVTAFLTPPDEANGKYLLNGAEVIGGGDTLTSSNIRDPEIATGLKSMGAAAGAFVDLDALIAPDNDWNDQIFNEKAPSQTFSYKANDGSTLSGTLTQSSSHTTTSNSSSEGASLTLKSGDGAISLIINSSDSRSDTYASGSWSHKDSFTYLDTCGTSTTTDDLKAAYTASASGSWTAKSTGWTDHMAWAETQSYNHGGYSLAVSISGVADRAGTNPDDWYTADVKDTETATFSNYSFKDAGTGFAVSFSGKVVDDYLHDSQTLTLSTLSWTTADYQLTTANLTRTTNQADSIQLNGYKLGATLDDAGNIVDLSTVDDYITTTMQDFVLSGNNVVTITNNAGVTFDAGAGNDTLTGGTGDDSLTGGAGNDLLKGGLGNDQLVGGDGNDIFRFDTLLNAATNVDTLQDFVHQADKIQLENSIFTKLTTTGALTSGNFVAADGAVAHDANDFILYDTSTGNLYYDADGSGAGAAIQFATLIGQPTLAASDFTIT